MVEASKPTETKPSKDRSPSFPFIPLKTAIERLEAFEKLFGRHPARVNKAGPAWGMKEKSSQADQTLAALRSFGLLKYDGMGDAREASLTDEGRTYVRAQQDSVKKQILKQCALRPKIMRKFWSTWGADRPPDPVAIDDLTLKNGFSDGGAANFLKVYDDTISYAGLSVSDKIEPDLDEDAAECDADTATDEESLSEQGRRKPSVHPHPQGKVKLMDGERVVFTEESNPHNYLKLVASGEVDETMLEALEDYVKRQKKRLAPKAASQAGYKIDLDEK